MVVPSYNKILYYVTGNVFSRNTKQNLQSNLENVNNRVKL